MVCSSDRYLANGIVAIARMSGWTKPRVKPAVFSRQSLVCYVFDEPSGLLKQSGEDRLRMVGIKILMCESVFGETAFLKDSYLDGPMSAAGRTREAGERNRPCPG